MRKNLGLKVFSLVLAMVVWLQITLSSEHRTVVNLPVVLDNLAPEITLSDLPKTIPFNVKGTGLDLLRLNFSSAKVVLDASQLTPGSNKLPMDDYSLRDLPANSGVEVVGPASDSKLSFNTDVLHHKSVKVVPSFENEAARARYVELDFLLSPDQIRINGPRRDIRDLKTVSTAPISIQMLSQDRFDIPVSFNSNQISSTIAKVSVSRVPLRIETKVFEALRVDAGNRIVFPQTVTLKVDGSPEQLKTLKSGSFSVRTVGEPDRDGWMELEVVLPEGIDKYALTPERVRAR